MKSLLLLSAILPLTVFSHPTTATSFDPTRPIYLGDVFWPPTMTFIAWLPSEEGGLTEWCNRATDASNHMLFALGGVDALQIHNYFGDEAYITREGKRFANCWVTPEAGRMGACEGVVDWDCEGGHKFTGPGTRRWSCWVLDELRGNLTKELGIRDGMEQNEMLTDGMYMPTNVQTGVMKMGSSSFGAFTAGATGS
ncbi:hypothetical protein L207DRAFT_521146 [Hyaloscypha variabilis F]|uniref:Uncharacterized protein n=1 Tax=Hyaloscypha variabilis (strain UAMH 11265 / GT02V1 / F) TaxID=1149755 RepID=A0A2J6QSD9_HYAVF|nr:hypothetical protein L207DRAFT_521146 [Hyaloscypha variabilis F]